MGTPRASAARSTGSQVQIDTAAGQPPVGAPAEQQAAPAEPGMKRVGAVAQRLPGLFARRHQMVVEVTADAHGVHLLDADMGTPRRVRQDHDRPAQRP
jgi:hypothetical protein